MKHIENVILVICAALLSWVMIERIGAYAEENPGYMFSFIVLTILLATLFIVIYDTITFLVTGKRRD